ELLRAAGGAPPATPLAGQPGRDLREAQRTVGMGHEREDVAGGIAHSGRARVAAIGERGELPGRLPGRVAEAERTALFEPREAGGVPRGEPAFAVRGRHRDRRIEASREDAAFRRRARYEE